jgi:hypothetical protein
MTARRGPEKQGFPEFPFGPWQAEQACAFCGHRRRRCGPVLGECRDKPDNDDDSDNDGEGDAAHGGVGILIAKGVTPTPSITTI